MAKGKTVAHGATLGGNSAKSATSDRDAALKALVVALMAPDWRDQCRKGLSEFGAISTYLSQFLAHDLIHTVGLNSSFTRTAFGDSAGPTNLRRNMLQLDTLYGEGLDLDPQLYEPNMTNPRQVLASFRLNDTQDVFPNERTAPMPAFAAPLTATEGMAGSKPILGDARNASQPMTMAVTTTFMAYHNMLVAGSENGSAAAKFMEARVKTILAWHNIIETDIIGTILSPESQVKLPPKDKERAATVAAFRSFHALIQSSYVLRSVNRFALSDLLSPVAVFATWNRIMAGNFWNPDQSVWETIWAVDLGGFLGKSPENTTVMTASYSDQLLRDGVPVPLLDMIGSAAQGGAVTSSDLGLESVVRQLLDQLETEGRITSAERAELNDPPALIGFLAESQYGANPGRLGPVASALVRASLMAELDGSIAQLAKITGFPEQTLRDWQKKAPKTFESLWDATF